MSTSIVSEVRKKNSIGASEAAAAAGVHPRKKQITLWQELLGLAPDFDGNNATEWGLRLEPVVQTKYRETHGVELLCNPQSVYRDGWKRASPDALIWVPPRASGCSDPSYGLEVKCPEWRDAERWGEGGGDDVPTEYLVQCVWSMHVTGLPRWDVAALIGAHDYREFQIHRDAELEEMLVQEVERFWVDHVLKGEPPDPDGSTDYSRWWAQQHKKIRNDFIRADEERTELIRQLRHAKCMSKQVEADIEMLEQRIKVVVADAAGIEFSAGFCEKTGHELFEILTCRPRKGRTVIDWDAICDALVTSGVVTNERLQTLLTTYSRESAPSRPLLTPRSWNKEVTQSPYTPRAWEKNRDNGAADPTKPNEPDNNK